MNRKDTRIHEKIKRNLVKRLDRKTQPEKRGKPVFGSGGNIHYEYSEKACAVSCGGLGIMRAMVQGTGLGKMIDEEMHLLKQHHPYHESDHIFNMAFNILAGGQNLEDLEVRRSDPGYLDALEAERCPDPTTARDFLPRFSEEQILGLMDLVNRVRRRIWKMQSASFRQRAELRIDGTIVETGGECKEKMDISYDGRWGYGPVIVSLANTREPLYIENRPASASSNRDAIAWIDRSIGMVRDIFQEVSMTGDTAYYLTKGFDRWTEQGVKFVFGCDSWAGLVKRAEETTVWEQLQRPPAYTVKTKRRRRSKKVKEEVIREREFEHQELELEYVAEIPYRPAACTRDYRLVMLKKIIKVTKGQLRLFDEVRYFFYITNDERLSTAEVVYRSNDRCDHENDISQLKNGVRALRAPAQGFEANWAYMVIASLAWTLKAWAGLLMPHRPTGLRVIRMEFRRFLNEFINVPAQIIRRSGQLWYRLLGYMKHAPAFFGLGERCRHLALPV